MAVTIEDLYRNYGVLADAKDNLSQVSKGSCSYLNSRWGRNLPFSATVPGFTSIVDNFVDLRNRVAPYAKLSRAS